ncbi:shikimate kinase [Chloroflexota bacterium]
MRDNIALIGFMGVGKTAISQSLASKLGKKFVELDLLIERKAGKSIPEVFQQDGEISFRELEISVTKEIADKKNLVIACGGGLVLNKINIDRLKKESIIVYLIASPSIIAKRVLREVGRRPLLEVEDPTQTIRELLRFRRPFYERAADIAINTSKLNVDSVAKKIIEKLREYESFNFQK